jgi:hypothetical protein
MGNYSLTQSLLNPTPMGLYDIIDQVSPNSFYVRPCALLSDLFATDMAGTMRTNLDIANYGAYEYDVNFHHFDHWDPWHPQNMKRTIPNNEQQPQTRSSNVSVDWDLQIYPNPVASGEQVVVFLTSNFMPYDSLVNVKLFSTGGQLLLNQTYPTGIFTLQIPQIAPGIYVIHLQTQEGVYTKKLVVR